MENIKEQLYRGLSADRLVRGGADCFLRAMYKMAHTDIYVSREYAGCDSKNPLPQDYVPFVTKLWDDMGHKKALLNPNTKLTFVDTIYYGIPVCRFDRNKIRFNWVYITTYVDKIAQKSGWTKISEDFALPISWILDRKKVAIIFLGYGAEGIHTHYYIETDAVTLVNELQEHGFTHAYYKILN